MSIYTDNTDGGMYGPTSRRAEYPDNDEGLCGRCLLDHDACRCDAEPVPTQVEPRSWSPDSAALASILIAGLVVPR